MRRDEHITRHELMSAVRADRERFDRLVADVPRDLLAERVLPGGWSVKDVLAHVAWGHRESAGVARARALTGSDLWQLSQDERNEAVVAASRSRSLDEVLAEYRAASDEFERAIDELSEDALNDPDRIAGLSSAIPGWRPWRVLYDPDHLGEHGRAIVDAIGASRP